MIEAALLNAVLDARDFTALTRHGLAKREHWRDYPDAFEFIRGHMATYGELPSVESVVAHTAAAHAKDAMVAVFEPTDVVESIDTLCAKLKERNVKLDVAALLRRLAADYPNTDGYRLLDDLRVTADRMHQTVVGSTAGGVNWATSGADRWAAYQERKAIDMSSTLPAMFDEVTEIIGGYERGDMASIMAFTGRGKSWLGLLSALAANNAGYRPLVESGEMTADKCMFRLDTLYGGFSNRGLYGGALDARVEEQYRAYTSQFSRDGGRPDLYIRTPENWPHGLTLSQIESDIDATGCDMVIIDHFGLMAFGGKDRDAKTNMSRQLKQMAARKKVVVIVLYQTNGDYEKSKGVAQDGTRELRIPRLADYSETIALIQDSSIVFGFDAVLWRDEESGKYRGKALLGILKGRDGGEGTEFELEWMPNDGVIRPRQPTDVF